MTDISFLYGTMTTKAGEETEGRHAGGAKSRTARAEKATAEHEEATETLPMTRTEARATTGTRGGRQRRRG